MKIFILPALFFFSFIINGFSQPFTSAEISRWQKQASHVEIIRDKWGIPHVYGNTDADAVFGLMYAQCEDDFMRVEMNYIEKLGRTAEIKGETALYADLQMRMLIDSADAVKDYNKSPAWLKQLLNAFADGINFYLYKNPSIKPALLTRFKPWYPLLWTDGSIGAISTGGATEAEFKNFYSGKNDAVSYLPATDTDLQGSNGFAFSPSISKTGNAMLYINPHVTFYFRPEVHMVSKQGLNVYGAVTWGQFFIYQGFNEFCGWMHTSSDADVADLYRNDVKGMQYSYEGKSLPVKSKSYTIYYSAATGIKQKSLKGYFTHHGPVVASRNSEWISLKAQNRSLNGLIQSWQRTRAKRFDAYKKTMELKVNTSNNTVYADAAGNIAYWHGNFMPVRDTAYNWKQPVDGRTSKTSWKGLHKLEDLVYVVNPANGWLQNTNSTPYTVAGVHSPEPAHPLYMAPDAENFRGLQAVRLLSAKKSYSLDEVIAVGYDRYLIAFDSLLPALFSAYSSYAGSAEGDSLGEAVQVLKSWDKNVSESSVATTLAIHWAEKILPQVMKQPVFNSRAGMVEKLFYFSRHASAGELVNPLKDAMISLQNLYGSWHIAWGEINRFQRIGNSIPMVYDDAAASIPVPFASATWGMLPSYSSTRFAGTRKRYGVHGNSFVCAVEFGKTIKAKSLLAGGNSGNPASANFTDQAKMYAEGMFKEVYFYREDVLTHAVKTYAPGK